MLRRKFIELGVGSGLAGAAASGRVSVGSPVTVGGRKVETPPILSSYTSEDHRRRLQNIARCEAAIPKYVRRHLITDYIPGQAVYNLGEYPCRKPWDPDEYDERQLDELWNNGIRLVQVMEDWNDLLRLFGGDKYTSVNPAGLRRFIDMVHQRGMKILLYTSTGHFQITDPDYRPEWARPGFSTRAAHWQLMHCSAASAGWRAYVLPRTLGLMDEYEIDGLYNDAGSRRLHRDPELATSDEVLAFEESPENDGALGDMLSLIYSEVKRRGGIYKIHLHDSQHPSTAEQLWDYLWVGEGLSNADRLREETKRHDPYLVPIFDWRDGKLESDEEMFLHTVPFMQFPGLLAGRPFTGERSVIPGVDYQAHPLLDNWRERWRYHQANPDGPYSYGPWDAFPGRPSIRTAHARWLKRYYPLVEPGTYAYLEIENSRLLAGRPASDVVASVFVNLDTHLVLANYARAPAQIETTDSYFSVSDDSASPGKRFVLPPRSLLILRQST